jgi:N-carbamoylputrescine amidase
MKKKSQKLKIALVQMANAGSPAQNLAKAVARIRAAGARGAKIVCLQELFRTEYFCKTQDTRCFDLAEPVPGPTTEALGRAARASRVVVVASLFEKRQSGVYHNTAAVLDADGKFLGKYRKMHIPDDPGFCEKFYFIPGDLGFPVFETRYARIAALVCWDQWFPEAARIAALGGAEILFYPTAIGWKAGRTDEAEAYHSAWETVQRGHAIANGVFLAAVNRVGREGEFVYWGGSFVSDPFGRLVARAGTHEEILYADCDLGLVEQTRREWQFLRDRRIDAYGTLLQRAKKD